MEEHRSIQPVGQEKSRVSPRVCNGEKAVWIQVARVPNLPSFPLTVGCWGYGGDPEFSKGVPMSQLECSPLLPHSLVILVQVYVLGSGQSRIISEHRPNHNIMPLFAELNLGCDAIPRNSVFNKTQYLYKSGQQWGHWLFLRFSEVQTVGAHSGPSGSDTIHGFHVCLWTSVSSLGFFLTLRQHLSKPDWYLCRNPVRKVLLTHMASFYPIK